MLKILRAKLHGIHVTDCDLEYHGSITLDPEFCREAGIFPLEFVHIWNKNNGHRLSTYVLPGEPGSRCCVLNGAAARLCQKGDTLIISAVELVENPKALDGRRVTVLTFAGDNSIAQRLRYAVDATGEGGFNFRIESQ